MYLDICTGIFFWIGPSLNVPQAHLIKNDFCPSRSLFLSCSQDTMHPSCCHQPQLHFSYTCLLMRLYIFVCLCLVNSSS